MKKLKKEPIECQLRNNGIYAQVVKKRKNRKLVQVIQRAAIWNN
ncbi:MAG: hypothetical protein P0S93_03050 [Candidatus Neptunochlamydia sp.]|nr:hypothetical protein [Candidatus Neptunochlamydia sp.]